MVRASERLVLIIKAMADSRLRNDIKALKYAAAGYMSYGWELCEELGIADMLEKGAGIDEIEKGKEVKDRRFLEHLLDFLVGCGVLRHKRGKYRLIKKPGHFTGKEYEFLERFYPNSVEWTHELRAKGRDVLLQGKKKGESGFDHRRFLDLWDGIMRESPWSFRRMAIRKFSKSIRNGAEVLDLGCGSGVSIEQIILECSKLVKITGMDQSRVSLDKARKRLDVLHKSSRRGIERENIKRVELIQHDLLEGISSPKKYDVVFMSLLVNHIPENRRPEFFRKVRGVIKNGGLCVIYQIIHDSRFRRAPMWVMHTVPTHHDYPFREEYERMLRGIFREVKMYLGGVVVVAKR
jgi:SAM-dependent methyltransferase